MITGASSGIGRESARLFAREGCQLALAARRLERLNGLADEIRQAGGEAEVFQTDLNLRDAPAGLAQAVLDRFGCVDVLVNNAGFGRLDWLEELDPVEDIVAQLQVNLVAPIVLTRHLLPQMIDRGKGSIINVASLASFIPTPLYSIYTSSKFGLRGFTDGLRRELRSKGINVTGIYPGFTTTEFIEHVGRLSSQGSRTPRFLWLSAEQVARQVVQAAWRPRRAVIMPWFLGIVLAFDALFPGITDAFLDWYFSHRIKLRIENDLRD